MPKEDNHHLQVHRPRPNIRLIVSICSAIFSIIVIIIIITSITLHPTKPKFYLQNLHLTKINASPASNTPPTLEISLQATLSSRNPNSRIGIYYSSLDTYVTYRDEQVTIPVALPPVYEGHKDVTMWSPVLYGSGVPVDPYVADAVAQDEAAGLLLLHVKFRWTLWFHSVPVGRYDSKASVLNIEIVSYEAEFGDFVFFKVAGKVKWKVGSFTSGHYHLFVSCPVFVSPSNGNPIRGEGLSEIVECHVAV